MNDTIFASLEHSADMLEEQFQSHLHSTEPESSVWERIGLAALIVAAPITVVAAGLSTYFVRLA